MVDNQHKQIKGYRDLSHADIQAMNDCKAVEAQFNGMIDRLRALPGVDQRNVALAQTHGEDAFMRAVRSIAQPARLTDMVEEAPQQAGTGQLGSSSSPIHGAAIGDTPNGFTR